MQVTEALTRGAELFRNWWKGLRRHPVDVAKQIEARLWGKPFLALKDVGCSFRAGVRALRGCVGTTALKDIAEAVVSRIEGVELVVNEIEVMPAATASEGAACKRRAEGARRAGPTSPAS